MNALTRYKLAKLSKKKKELLKQKAEVERLQRLYDMGIR